MNGDRQVAANAGVLLAGQVVGLVAPIIAVPYLARTLGPNAWGPVLAAQALSNWLLMVLDFAFDLSGTREVARSRQDPDATTRVVHGVQSAKLLLVAIATPVAAGAALGVPMLRAAPALVAGGLIFAIAKGLSPLWYFQGVERMKAAVAVDTGARAAAALSVFVVVHSPADAWRVLALQAGFSLLALGWLTFRLTREVAFRAPGVGAGLATLRAHATVFACRTASGVYIQGNSLILGVVAPASVPFFGGADRIIRAAVNLLLPITQAVLPRMSHLQRHDSSAARRLLIAAFVGMGAVGALMSVVAYAAAPLLVTLLLGPGYDAAVPLLRAMSLLPALISINGVLGIFWALPYGHERLFLRAIVAAGVVNVGVGLAFVSAFGAMAFAAGTVAAEATLLAVLLPAFRRR